MSGNHERILPGDEDPLSSDYAFIDEDALLNFEGKTASEVVRDIQRYNQHRYHPTQDNTIAKRNGLVEKAGYNPNEWVWWSNSSASTIDSIGSYFPPRLQALVVSGSYMGGESYGTHSFSLIKDSYDPDGLTIFIRECAVGDQQIIRVNLADSGEITRRGNL